LSINTKISGNELLWKIIDNKSFQEVVEKNKFSNDVNRDLLKKIYNELILTQEYKEYIETQTREKKSEKKIIEFIFSNLMLPNEEFIINVLEQKGHRHFLNFRPRFLLAT
jgi:N utilization substance protein B